MSFLIRLDDMQEALSQGGHPLADHFETILCTIGNTMAELLAQQYDITCGETTQEGSAFAGMCCPFHPKYRGQALPEAFEGLDAETEWDNDHDGLPPMPVEGLVEPVGPPPIAPPEDEPDTQSHCGKCGRLVGDHNVGEYDDECTLPPRQLDWSKPVQWSTGEEITFAPYDDLSQGYRSVSSCQAWSKVTGDNYVHVNHEDGEIMGVEGEYPTVVNVPEGGVA